MNDLVTDLLAFDSSPPDASYSPLDHGEKLGAQVSANEANQIVRLCWQSLPGSLAESFLDGFMETAVMHCPSKVFLECLSDSREVSSAALIVRFLKNRFQVTAEEITAYCLARLRSGTNAGAQDRLAYAILAAGAVASDQKRLLSTVLEMSGMSEYAEKCLSEALRRGETHADGIGN